MSAQEEISNIYKVAQNTSRLLLALGDVVVGWLLLRQAEVAAAKLAEGAADKDVAFYEARSLRRSSSLLTLSQDCR